MPPSDAPAKISLGLGKIKKPAQPPPTNGVKRSHAALKDEDDEADEHGKVQTVTKFDAAEGGAFDERKPPQKEVPLVIAPQANRDWKDASKRRKQRNGLPADAQAGLSAQSKEELIKAAEDAVKPIFGLNVKKAQNGEDVAMENGHAENEHVEEEVPPERITEPPTKAKTDEEEAMDALLGITRKSDLVVPVMDEDQAFQQDFGEAPDMATLDEYQAMPVEQFGAALLRGMGWKEGEGIGSQRGRKVEKVKQLERRPALLGIGAKEEAAVAQELGAWGKAAKGPKGAAVGYTPVLMRDKKTGEMFTEEELEKRKERALREQYDREFEEHERKREISRKHREDEKDRNGRRRENDRRADKDDDSEEDYRRRKEKERRRRERERDESEEDYRRRKEKERRRHDRDRNDSSHDRDRSRRHDEDRHRYRDRRRDERQY